MSADRVRAWVEPTRSLPLHWGRYTDRYLMGLVLIIAGGIGLQASNTWANYFLLQGALVYAIGWSILPSRGWRRAVIVAPATGQLWLLLTGPYSVMTLVVPYLAWLLVRHRPLRSYVTVILPIANGFIVPMLFVGYGGMLGALGVSLAVLAISAWLARLLASTKRPAPPAIPQANPVP
ncbi:small-conductance mechanosensitive channel [Microbacteriaceae bacterium SG_E_30_P1]|uniref:Small-conductance mechanosensitive channel n=1 Tax=Antiquaquibacter oligotrophicus TaxID=2880260 RepID=A0ABT6KJ96_9MICO|nr:hypothetical protein [Antiquaquibacter oligotrophicus]MDH6179975.1 small-conductance mechanosensitive channel [Antiquaquibacter oligotrophicus]UDF14268.1 hypothetical protein LH407_05240 [Antiquaquibacter oligotrophicus]